MNSSADFSAFSQLPCSGSNAGASYSSGAGLDGIGGRTGDAVHNFTYQRADWPRLVPVGFNGVVEVFIWYPFHSGNL